ncbi:hydantoinase/carbamoylase family amidase [Bordetella sp. N]|uniref:hydantoinase/carbamoylase family amidase n=1 Tax=Bordetella sp. N TaxID=1746199 RepID=UPI000A6F443D|nr:hydantoinase/carbamoylase family amidase [Bordetella sp. N]
MSWSDQLALHTDQAGALTCAYMTPAHRAVAAQLDAWMRESGFDEVRHDAIGNVIGVYRADPAVARPRIVSTGSHYDTVRDGGKYDGRLGILLPMAIVADLHARDQRLPYDFEVVAFAEEEGLRFGSTFLGSSAYIGRFDETVLDKTDADGITMRAAIANAGLDPARSAHCATDVDRIKHYFEVHIEQGPVLLDSGLPLGVVTAINGGVRRILTLTGLASHAGTTPMAMRHDAACAAAEIILYVEQRCASVPALVGTVGTLQVVNGSVNVVPGVCRLSLDLRAPEDGMRDAALADIEARIAEICQRRGVRCETEEVMRKTASACAPGERALWAKAIAAQGAPVYELPSGAGHDAMMVGQATSMSMLFVRCGNGGISHNPLEIITIEDAQLAAQATQAFMLELAAA